LVCDKIFVAFGDEKYVAEKILNIVQELFRN